MFKHPRFGRVVRAGDQRAQPVDGVDAGDIRQRFGCGCLDIGAVVFGRVARERFKRQVGFDLTIVHDQETVLGDCFAYDGEIEVPFVEDGFRLCLKLGTQDHQHPFLGFRQHHLVGGHGVFAGRDLFEVQTYTKVALVAHLYGRTGQARSAHILDRNHGTGRHQFERGFHQALFGEGVADLNGGTFVFDGVVELGRCHRRAAHTVAAGFRAKVNDRHANAGSGGIEDLVGVGQTGGKGVHKAVAIIGGVKTHFAAHRGHAKAVTVAAHTRDHAMHQLACLAVVGRPEAKRVHRRDRTRAHREDVPQDAAHAGRRTLIGFDVGRVVVALHLEDQRLAIADINDARILARAADHLWAFGRQGTQPFL